MMYKSFKLMFLLTACALTTHAEPVDFSVNLGLEFRGFYQDPLFSTQGQGVQPSVYLEPEWKWRSENRKHRFSAIGFARWDEQDSERTHVDVRELYWSYNEGPWTTTLGVNKVFWGVTESVHLVDTINQTDLVEDLDQEDKLGQPMIHISNQQNWGRIELFVLPYFRERLFAGADGRFGLGFEVSDDSLFESGAEENHVDVALRYSHYIGDMDLGLHLFKGTDREPLLRFDEQQLNYIPYYQQMNQFGVDLQYTKEAWLWKLESIYRDTQTDQFWAAVGGFEYTLYQLNESDADLGLLLEYQYDGRSQSSAPTTADNDVFVAARYALNDSNDSSILGGMSYDVELGSVFVNLEAKTRLNDHLTVDLSLRALTHTDPEDNAFVFNRNDYVELSFNWFY